MELGSFRGNESKLVESPLLPDSHWLANQASMTSPLFGRTTFFL